ncbi:MAG: FesM [Anaerolineae bacterium]
MRGQADGPGWDLLALPGLGRFLRWRHARSALAVPLLLLAGLMVFDGLTGPQLAPKNLATVLVWIHYRGLVVVALLLVGNLFCLACPFMLVRNVVRRFVRPARLFPRRLRTKWLAVGLFAALLFAYELFDLWASPRGTAWLIVGYFAGAVAVDAAFRGASFCKYLCPLGQFNFLSSTLSPLEVGIRRPEPCAECATKPCITGKPVPGGPPSADQTAHCQLWLFQPQKVGNLDCTFCLDCLHACPYDNVGLTPRLPAETLALDGPRSSLGRLSRRPDLAALAVVFTFGALLNAFAMVSPVYALEEWLAGVLGTGSELPVLALIFLGGLAGLPALLLGLAGWLSQPAGGTGLISWITRFAYALLPLGFGIWLAHYSFHFLTGFWTFVPVVQSFVSDLAGTPLLGAPRWDLAALLPAAWLNPLELGFLGLGWFGSLLVAYRIAEREAPERPWRAFVPWAVLLTLLLIAGIWLMGQPMEMRGTFMAG